MRLPVPLHNLPAIDLRPGDILPPHNPTTPYAFPYHVATVEQVISDGHEYEEGTPLVRVTFSNVRPEFGVVEYAQDERLSKVLRYCEEG